MYKLLNKVFKISNKSNIINICNKKFARNNFGNTQIPDSNTEYKSYKPNAPNSEKETPKSNLSEKKTIENIKKSTNEPKGIQNSSSNRKIKQSKEINKEETKGSDAKYNENRK